MLEDQVVFSMSRGGISVSATVSRTFFEKTVQPVVELLLAEMTGKPAQVSSDGAAANGEQSQIDLSVKAICQRLGAKTGSDVLRAGAISLALVRGQAQFGRKEVLAEAQKAAGYWKQSYSKDFGRYLNTLQTQKFLIEGASGQLSLSAKAELDAGETLRH